MAADEQRAGVVVGIDGSAPSLGAVDWAVHTAENEELTLCLVLPPSSVAGVPIDAFMLEELHERAASTIAHGRSHAHAASASIRTRAELRWGNPADELLRLSHQARMIVVANRGTGWFPHLQLGATAARIAAGAGCPAVIVRPTRRPRGPVVIGIDDAATAHEAIAFGIDSARRTGCDVLALRALNLSVDSGHIAHSPDQVARLRETAQTGLQKLIAPWSQNNPEIPLRVATMRDRAARVLVEASRQASLVVVSARDGSGTAENLGSVSRHVLELATCPVAIIH